MPATTTPAADWADKYSTATLQLALHTAYTLQRDPAHMMDVAWHDAHNERIRQIVAAIALRPDADA